MGIFSGLFAHVEGAVTSIETGAAGLFPGGKPAAPAAPAAPASYSMPFVGPLYPGETRPAPFTVTPPAPAAVVSAPTSPGSFNMVSDMLSKVPGVSTVENFFGAGLPTAAPKDFTADASSWAKDLQSWDLTLKSADNSMNAKDGASDLSSQLRAWRSGPWQLAQDKLSALVTGGGNYADTQAAHDDAVTQAKALFQAIQDRWTQFSESGVPTVADYVKAPFQAASSAAQTVYAGASRAEAALQKALPAAASGVSTLLEYGPWIAGGLALLYVASFLPRSGNRS